MKLLIASLMTFASLTSIRSDARSIHPDTFKRVSTLVQFDLDAKLSYRAVGGELTINPVKREMIVFIDRRQNCPPNRLCPAVVPAPLVINVPLVSTKTDPCGNVTFMGREDLRPVDGNLEVLVVTDSSRNICNPPTANVRHLPVMIRHQIVTAGMGGQPVRFNSTMYGTALVSPFTRETAR